MSTHRTHRRMAHVVAAVTTMWATVVLCVVLAGNNGGCVEARQPGTLILTMLTRDEAENLDRTLPRWAKIIDYWIVAIDEKNTDNSPEIIRKHLGHLPGEMMTVHFDGMGPTWTKLVERGLELFPQATHGIVADADFAPMRDTLDKMQLDVRCSKHMFSIWTEDHLHERKLDWIYRNIKGAKVSRRVHQIVEVPKMPNQEVFQTLIDLPIEERSGGYQDRTGKKFDNYIFYLKKDLVDYPDDPRTLYYLAYAHFDKFLVAKDDPGPEHWQSLAKAVEYFDRRIALPTGNLEEKWFAVLKQAEIQERFYKDWDKAFAYYKRATEEDPERCDPWFYIGQHYRLSGDAKSAFPWLKRGASLALPQRSLFQWMELYDCLVHLEIARVAAHLPELDEADLRLVLDSARKAADKCTSGNLKSEAQQFVPTFEQRVNEAASAQRLAHSRKQMAKFVPSVNLFLDFVAQNTPALKQTFRSDAKRMLLREFVKFMDDIRSLTRARPGTPCRTFRLKTTPYLRWFAQKRAALGQAITDAGKAQLLTDWENANASLLKTCR